VRERNEHIRADHLKKLLRLLINFLENAYDFRYTNFQFHRRFSFPEVTRPPRLGESDGGQAGRWHAKLDRTICIQPGQLNEFTYVTIDLSTMKFDRIKEQYVT